MKLFKRTFYYFTALDYPSQNESHYYLHINLFLAVKGIKAYPVPVTPLRTKAENHMIVFEMYNTGSMPEKANTDFSSCLEEKEVK